MRARDKVRHRGRPAEPFAPEGAYGIVNRVTPPGRNIPGQVSVSWEGGFSTWERQRDLELLTGPKTDKGATS